LEEEGYRVLIQAWDMVAGSSWIRRMDQGVQRAARVVAVVSPDYVASVYGTAEWQAAWVEDVQRPQRKLITVRVRGERPPGLLAGVVGIDLVGLSEAPARQRLRDEIAAAVRGRAKPGSSPPFTPTLRAIPTEPRFPGALPEVFTAPGRNPHFTGRSAELDTICTGLGAGSVMTVHGLGGVGKSQTVIEYAHRHATAHQLVWWINAEQPALISSQLAALAEPLGLPTNADLDIAARAVCAELRRRHGWLLIFDNAEDVGHIRPFLPGGTGHVLITTRRGGFGFVGPVLDLDVFSRPEAVALLFRRVPQLTDEHADAVAGLLGDLPLALEQAAAYLDQTQLPPADYLHLLTIRAADMYGRGRVVDHQHTVATLWSLSLEKLRSSQPAAVQLLNLCAYLAPEPIPLDLITDHPECLPAPLRHVAGDALAFAETVGALVDYSLARRTNAGLLVHRLVQGVIRQPGVHQPEDPHPLRVVLNLLRTNLPDEIMGAVGNWPRWLQLLPHVLAATDHHDDLNPSAAADASWLLDHAGIYQRSRGRLPSAPPLLERALRLRETACGPDHPAVATTLDHLALVVRDLGEPATARPLYEQALHINESVYGPDHPEVASVLQGLAGVLCDLGEPAAAQALLERVLHINETAYGPDHPVVANTLRSLARTLRALDEPVTAQLLLHRALQMSEITYGPNHPVVAAMLLNLASALRESGEPAAAQPLLERALYLYETSYGADHPAVATTRLEEAVEHYRRLAQANPAAYLPDLAGSLNNLGIRLDAVGRREEALAPTEEAVEHYRRLAQANPAAYLPDLATSLNNLGNRLDAVGQREEAEAAWVGRQS
jgi:tetratricopeptide (TPR) repeat protein